MAASRKGEHIIGHMRSSSLERFVLQLCQLKLPISMLASEARSVKRKTVNI
jgi:hypothetical protein